MPTNINTRTELINALNEAAEIEHGLLCQYLFAAFSLKAVPEVDELGPARAELVREWKGYLLWIAVEEMAHLGTVCNLLSAIGGAPHLSRPPFPQVARYFPAIANDGEPFLRFSLEPFHEETLKRFIRFETPEEELQAARSLQPDDLRYQTVGDLYGQIREAFLLIDEPKLFIGPDRAQDVDDWMATLRLHNVTDRVSATRAIHSIVVDGEGMPLGREDSHYATFLRIREQWREASASVDGFVPHCDVLSNPKTCDPEDDTSPSCITDPIARPIAELFNDVYTTALLMLVRYYSFIDDGEARMVALRAAIRQLMSSVLRPLGDLLTTYPARGDGSGQRAAPTFEIYTSVQLHADTNAAWMIIIERLNLAAEALRQLRRQASHVPRMKTMHENIHTLADTLSRL
jgi:hypothetical protein